MSDGEDFGYRSGGGFDWKATRLEATESHVRDLKAEIERLTAELETERMRLTACGVAALANTADSAARARDIRPEYRSASLDDVERAVDREIQLRDERDELRRQLAEMRAALVAAMEIVQKERTRIAYNAKGAPPAIYEGYADIMRRLDAVIAQADAAMGREG